MTRHHHPEALPGHALIGPWRVRLGTKWPNSPVYGTSARCECGARFKTNEGAPSKGGRRLVITMHEAHVDRMRQEAAS